MRIKIYQINPDRDKNLVKFLQYKHLDNFQDTKDINAYIYDEVFNGEVDGDNLEEIFRQFNTEGHPLHRGHSLSVSDVVVTKDGAYYCDNIGFQKVDFDEFLSQKPDNLMTVVYVEPHKAPYIAEIEHTLEAEQKAVGGLIEPIYLGDVCLVGNEEAKLIGMEGNRRVGDGTSIIAGPFFICGLTADDFRGLTAEEAEKYMQDKKKRHEAAISEGEIVMGGGHMSVAQLEAMLNTLPIEITFIDDNNINRFFNEGAKVFKRPGMAIDREVFSCHPPKIEPMVRSIIESFKNHTRDSVPVWMEKQGKPFLVTYYAVRDKKGIYLGTVEVVQDMQFAKEHFTGIRG